jgi:hypothetical protein
MQEVAFRAPPALAINEGAVTPDGGLPGAQAWSTILGKVLVWSGTAWVSLAPAFIAFSAALTIVTAVQPLPGVTDGFTLLNYV